MKILFMICDYFYLNAPSMFLLMLILISFAT
jgi:hypothetical protein